MNVFYTIGPQELYVTAILHSFDEIFEHAFRIRLADAYAAGWIDPTTLTNGTKDCRNKFYSDDFGVFTYWAGTWATNLKTNLENNGIDSELVALPPIAEVHPDKTQADSLHKEPRCR